MARIPDKPGATGAGRVSADTLMKILIVAVMVTGFSLACGKYSRFNGETNDVAVYSYAFAHTMDGHFFPLYYVPGQLLGNHLTFIILAWLPVYAMWRSFYSLMFFQSLMLTVAAWPFYLLAKDVLKNGWAALALGLAFLLFPTIVSQHVNQIHDDQFALPFLMGAFLYFWRRKFWPFVVLMVLACLAKETVTITTAAFGVYALCLRRDWKWVATPLVFSVGYFFLAMKLLTSVFVGAGGSLYTGADYLSAYGHSPGEVLHTFLTRPGFVLEQMFAPPKLEYLGKLLLPLLYVGPFLSAAVVVSLPNLLLNLIGSNSAFLVIPWHYNILVAGTLLVAMVFGIQRIAGWCGQKREAVVLGASVASLALSVMGFRYWYDAANWESPPEQAQLARALREVPRTASVIAPTPMLASFSDRPKINSAYSIFSGKFKDPSRLSEYQYVLLDGQWRSYEALGQVPLWETVRTSKVYRVVFAENNVLLLERTP
jgi:uncharacterized membrane protein